MCEKNCSVGEYSYLMYFSSMQIGLLRGHMSFIQCLASWRDTQLARYGDQVTLGARAIMNRDIVFPSQLSTLLLRYRQL